MAEPARRAAISGLAAGLVTASAVLFGIRDLSVGSFVSSILAGGCVWSLVTWQHWRRVALPGAELREAIERMASGNVGEPLPPRNWRALRGLATAVEGLRVELKDRLEGADAEEAQLRAVLADMVEGVLVLDSEGNVEVANQRLRELADVWGEIEGRPHWEVFRRGPLAAALGEAVKSGRVRTEEVALENPGDRVLQMHATPFTRAGVRLGTVAVFHDISELRRLERVRSDFVANVSHELKTPLTAIRGFAETLRAEDVDGDQLDRYLGVIERHAQRLSRLIDDLLTLSRVEGRTATIELEAIDLRRSVSSVLADMSDQLESRGLEISQKHTGESLVWSDRMAVEQVLVNLIDNAAKYTDPGGRIEVRTEATPSGVRLTVEDSGIGIADAQKARIFERFYRVDEARGRDVGGTGLGLAIVRHLVQLSDGDIRVESEPGKGSSFIVSLPGPPRNSD